MLCHLITSYSLFNRQWHSQVNTSSAKVHKHGSLFPLSSFGYLSSYFAISLMHAPLFNCYLIFSASSSDDDQIQENLSMLINVWLQYFLWYIQATHIIWILFRIINAWLELSEQAISDTKRLQYSQIRHTILRCCLLLVVAKSNLRRYIPTFVRTHFISFRICYVHKTYLHLFSVRIYVPIQFIDKTKYYGSCSAQLYTKGRWFDSRWG